MQSTGSTFRCYRTQRQRWVSSEALVRVLEATQLVAMAQGKVEDDCKDGSSYKEV